MSRGVIYYNKGKKMLVRLAVSLHSLRKYYRGSVTILSEGTDSRDTCQRIATRYNANFQEVTYKTKAEKNDTYLNATLSHEKTPYDTTLWLDSDTLVRPAAEEHLENLFIAAETSEFAIAQIANWVTKGKIKKRIEMWKDIYPELVVESTAKIRPAINCGVFAFKKDAKLMADWWRLAQKGQHLFIPDETCCQLILPAYPHKIMDQRYNCSCKHSDPFTDDVVIVHYHGRKHCRIKEAKSSTRLYDFLNGCELWYKEFEEVRGFNVVKKNIQHDKQLRVHLPAWDRIK